MRRVEASGTTCRRRVSEIVWRPDVQGWALSALEKHWWTGIADSDVSSEKKSYTCVHGPGATSVVRHGLKIPARFPAGSHGRAVRVKPRRYLSAAPYRPYPVWRIKARKQLAQARARRTDHTRSWLWIGADQDVAIRIQHKFVIILAKGYIFVLANAFQPCRGERPLAPTVPPGVINAMGYHRLPWGGFHSGEE